MSSYLFPNLSLLTPNQPFLLVTFFLLDQDVEHYDSKIIFQDWSFNQDTFHDRILLDPIQLRDNNNVNGMDVKCWFFRTPYLLDWAAILTPIRPRPKPPP